MPDHTHTVIFLHIPKTAGTTLYRILEQNYAKKDIYTFWQDGSIDTFKQLSVERKAQIRLLRGHAGYGMHAYLPGPRVYFTMLRDPIKRTISYYHYARRVPAHYCYDLINRQQMSLLDFVTSGSDPMADNAHTRLLYGLESGQEIPAGQCTSQMLETATHNLARLAVVGLAEEFDAKLVLLKRAFGWQKLAYAPQNVADERSKRQPISAETLAALAEVNRFDVQLYACARELFHERVQQLGDSFQQESAALQATNRWLRPYYKIPLETAGVLGARISAPTSDTAIALRLQQEASLGC
jgi:hypothetical protein